MKFINKDHLVASATLFVSPERNIEETLRPVSITRIETETLMDVGLELLKSITGRSQLKITSPSKNVNISRSRSYFIVEYPQPDGELVFQQWVLNSEAAFKSLVEALASGKKLVTSNKQLTTRDRIGYQVVLTGADTDIVLSEDRESLWKEICKAYFNYRMRTMVRWEAHPSPSRVIENLCDGSIGTADQLVSFMEVMDVIMKNENEAFDAFVEADPWAFYCVGTDVRGLFISRHRDARAIIWDREQTEKLDIMERDA